MVLTSVGTFFLLKWLFERYMMKLPLRSRITSPFGMRVHPLSGENAFHNGTDFAGAVGDVIRAPAAGTVQSIYTNSVGGLQMIIKHANGFTSGYAHLSHTIAAEGDEVETGEPIANVGSSGQVTGPHLHFTLRNPAGDLVDPMLYLT